MHWLEEWRKRNGVDRRALARAADCSEELIYRIETLHTVTQKDIAMRIADCVGATPEQYNSLVNEIHYGKWSPEKKPAMLRQKAVSPPVSKREYICRGRRTRPLYSINLDCKPVTRYETLAEASEMTKLSQDYICRRCREGLQTNEFELNGVTFRYVDDWENGNVDMDSLKRWAAFSKEQRRLGIQRSRKSCLLTLGDETRSIDEWAEALGVCKNTIKARMQAGMPMEKVLSRKNLKRRKDNESGCKNMPAGE